MITQQHPTDRMGFHVSVRHRCDQFPCFFRFFNRCFVIEAGKEFCLTILQRLFFTFGKHSANNHTNKVCTNITHMKIMTENLHNLFLIDEKTARGRKNLIKPHNTCRLPRFTIHAADIGIVHIHRVWSFKGIERHFVINIVRNCSLTFPVQTCKRRRLSKKAFTYARSIKCCQNECRLF